MVPAEMRITHDEDETEILCRRPLQRILVFLVCRIARRNCVYGCASCCSNGIFDEDIFDEAVDDTWADVVV